VALARPAQLFATYLALAAEARAVVRAHVDTLVGQLAQIIADGVAHGEFAAADPVVAGRAVFDATARTTRLTRRSGRTLALTPLSRASGRLSWAGWARTRPRLEPSKHAAHRYRIGRSGAPFD